MKSILKGVRVLDLGRFIAAPLCGSFLAELGADVVRVEPPGGAEDRYLMSVCEGGEGGSYLQCNRGKRSLALDTSSEQGQAALARLIAEADIVLVSLPPKALERSGLDYETLRKIKPDIISVQVAAFSGDSPDRNRGGYDGIGQSMSGAMYLTGFDARPCRAVVSYVDYSTGISCAYGTLAAVINKLRTGEGTLVESNLLTTAMNMMAPMYIEEATGSRSRVATGNRSPIAGPSDLFATGDGWVLMQVIGNPMFKRWSELVERPDLLEDPRFATDQLRGDNGEILSDIMSKWCAELSTEECLQRLEQARLPAGRVLTPAEVIDPLTGLVDCYFEQDRFPGIDTPVPIPKQPASLSTPEGQKTRRAPVLGEHSEQVLRDYKFSEDEIRQLINEGLVCATSD